MFRGVAQTTRNGYCLRGCSVFSKLKLAGVAHLAAHNEKGLFKILQLHIDGWIVQYFGVRRPQRIRHFGQGLSFHLHVFDAAQGDVSVGLHSHRLVEFRRKRKLECQDVGRMQLIAPVAVLQDARLAVVVGCTFAVASDLLGSWGGLDPAVPARAPWVPRMTEGSGKEIAKRCPNSYDFVARCKPLMPPLSAQKARAPLSPPESFGRLRFASRSTELLR